MTLEQNNIFLYYEVVLSETNRRNSETQGLVFEGYYDVVILLEDG